MHTPRLAAPLLSLLLLGACSDKDGTDDSGMDGHDMSDDTALDLSTEQMSDGGTWMVSYTTSPSPIPYNEYFDLTVSISGATGTTVAVDAKMPEHNHGMNTTPETTDNGDGTWTTSPMLFHMEGTWEFYVDVTTNGSTERATFYVMCCEG